MFSEINNPSAETSRPDAEPEMPIPEDIITPTIPAVPGLDPRIGVVDSLPLPDNYIPIGSDLPTHLL